MAAHSLHKVCAAIVLGFVCRLRNYESLIFQHLKLLHFKRMRR